MAKSLLNAKGLPKSFWAEANHTATYILNRSSTSALNKQTPLEAWFGWKRKLTHFRVFGCTVFVHIPSQKRGKLDENNLECIFLGYSDESKAYRFYNPLTKKLLSSRDVMFDEKSAWNLGNNATQRRSISRRYRDHRGPNGDRRCSQWRLQSFHTNK